MLEFKLANDLFGLLYGGQYDEAVALAANACEAIPDDHAIWETYAAALCQTARPDLAWPAYERSKALIPSTLDWKKQQSLALHRMLAYDFLPQSTVAGGQAIRQEWVDLYQGPIAPRQRPAQPDPDRKLRVGICGPDFRQTSAYCCFAGLLYWPTTELECYVYSDVVPENVDRYTDGTKRWLGPRFRETLGYSTERWLQTVRDDHIDILIDTGGYTSEHRLYGLLQRAAPVQLAYAPGIHLPTHDWFLGDGTLDGIIPEAQIARMPCLLGYEPLKYYDAVPRVPDEPFTFGNLGRPIKFNAETFALWTEILNAVPDSRLLLAHTFFGLVPSIEPHVRAQFPGIDQTRIIIRACPDHPEYMGNYGHLDLMLDTWPQNGGMTTIEALHSGVPVLTLQGETIVSKAGASILKVLGLDDLIVTTPEAYVKTAIMAATEPEMRAWILGLRGTVRQAVESSPFWGRQYAKAFRETLRTCWKEACQW